MNDPFRDQFEESPRRFKRCKKCGHVAVEALWVERSLYGETSKDPEWWHVPWINTHGQYPHNFKPEGFFVRCKTCSFAWFEPMKEDQNPTEPEVGL